MRYGWNLRADQWQMLRKAISGCSWSRTYLEGDYAAQVPTISGVYMICASTKRIPIAGTLMDQMYNVIYTGQASNLRRRFRGHVQGYGNVVHAKTTFGRLDFWYIPIKRPRLSEIEQLLLDTFGPTANVNNVKARIGDPVPAGRVMGV